MLLEQQCIKKNGMIVSSGDYSLRLCYSVLRTWSIGGSTKNLVESVYMMDFIFRQQAVQQAQAIKKQGEIEEE